MGSSVLEPPVESQNDEPRQMPVPVVSTLQRKGEPNSAPDGLLSSAETLNICLCNKRTLLVYLWNWKLHFFTLWAQSEPAETVDKQTLMPSAELRYPSGGKEREFSSPLEEIAWGAPRPNCEQLNLQICPPHPCKNRREHYLRRRAMESDS